MGPPYAGLAWPALGGENARSGSAGSWCPSGGARNRPVAAFVLAMAITPALAGAADHTLSWLRASSRRNRRRWPCTRLLTGASQPGALLPTNRVAEAPARSASNRGAVRGSLNPLTSTVFNKPHQLKNIPWGHETGNEVLRTIELAVSRLESESSARTDMVARVGGQRSFVVLFCSWRPSTATTKRLRPFPPGGFGVLSLRASWPSPGRPAPAPSSSPRSSFLLVGRSSRTTTFDLPLQLISSCARTGR